MKIDVVTTNGSPIGVTPLEIEWPGVGGGELMLLQWSREMAKRGHDICIYNQPRQYGVHDGVSFKNRNEFDKDEERDVLLSFRGPIDVCIGARCGISVGWSIDQFNKDFQQAWYAIVDGIVGISDFHRNDHIKRHGLSSDKMTVIAIGCCPEDFRPLPKIPFQFIYNSMPGRGLEHFKQLWPVIHSAYPKARLLVTSGLGLWSAGKGPDHHGPLVHDLRNLPGVEFLGRISRSELLRHEMESEIHLYPCTYEELFCISVAETQMAGCHVISSSAGALPTTNSTGHLSPYTPGTEEFLQDVRVAIDSYYALSSNERNNKQAFTRKHAQERFRWSRICEEWESYFAHLLKCKKETKHIVVPDALNVVGGIQKSSIETNGSFSHKATQSSLEVLLRTHVAGNIRPDMRRVTDTLGGKPELVLRSIRSLVRSLEELSQAQLVDITLSVFDDHSDTDSVQKMHELIALCSFKTRFVPLEEKGAALSQRVVFEAGKNSSANLLYFIEDDYLHEPSALLEMIQAYTDFSKHMDRKDIGIYPVDYIHRYTRDAIAPTRVVLGSARHWRLVERTTGSFLIPRAVLLAKWHYFLFYAENGLNEEISLNDVWRNHIPMWSPIPTLAYHMNDEDEMPPFSHWKRLWDMLGGEIHE
ncbi:MAG: glycosyltransferase family 4 protein [bacterium]|nr:glycosyltransferase family 4 protein [bacterium]